MLIQGLANQAIKDLTEKLQKARKTSAPKRKFEFKTPLTMAESQAQATGKTIMETVDAGKVSLPGVEYSPERAPQRNNDFPHPPPSNTSPSVTTVSLLFNDLYILDLKSLAIPSAALVNIDRSVVDLSASIKERRPLSTLTVKSAKQSLLICGRVDGAAHITGLQRSTLVLNSRQIRLHDCVDCVVYLRCCSRPIIEDCKTVRMAPLPPAFVRFL